MFDFSDEEKAILNAYAIDMSKDELEKKLKFNESISDDEDNRYLFRNLAEKIKKMSDTDWMQLQNCEIPYEYMADEDFKDIELDMNL